MARHRTRSIDFKRQIMWDYIAGEMLYRRFRASVDSDRLCRLNASRIP